MAITIVNCKISPYQQKDTLSKVIFGDVWSITIRLNTPHESGDGYVLAVDYERIVYPASHAVCAYSDSFEISQQNLTMSVTLDSSRLAKWLSDLKKPTPIYVQICRIRGGVYETLLLDEILALPSFVNPEMYADENTPVGELLEAKLDKPAEAGTEGQVLTLDNTLNPVWADAGAMTRQQADWTEQDAQSPTYIKHKPTIPTVGNGTITIKQGNDTKGSFDTNQSNNQTIELDSGITAEKVAQYDGYATGKADLVGGKVPQGQLPIDTTTTLESRQTGLVFKDNGFLAINVNSSFGVGFDSENRLRVLDVSTSAIDKRSVHHPITAGKLDYAVRSVLPLITALPADAASPIALTDASATTRNHSWTYTHSPDTAPTYQLPEVSDATITHDIVLIVTFSPTALSIVFQTTGGVTIPLDKQITPSAGDVWTFLCRYVAGGWRIYPIKEVSA